MAAGRLVLVDGDPGQGKSLLAIDLAARLTTGRPFPGEEEPREPAAAILLAAEDNLCDTIVPRFLAAGGDGKKVFPWDEDKPPVFPEDCLRLADFIRQTQARLVIFDPFFAFLGADVSSLNDLAIRRALDPLAGVAEATQAAILLLRHLSKTSIGKDARYRGLGSMAILGVARTAFLLAADPDDAGLRVLACIKNNLAALPSALGFRITKNPAGQPVLAWQGPVPRSADDLVATGRRRGEAVPHAVEFLLEHLSAGPCLRQTLLEQAAREGLSFRTLERAKSELGVLSQQRREDGQNVWYWMLRRPSGP